MFYSINIYSGVKKTSIFTFSGVKDALSRVTMLSAVEKHLSELTDVAGIVKYFFARLPITGYLENLVFHHSLGSNVLLYNFQTVSSNHHHH